MGTSRLELDMYNQELNLALEHNGEQDVTRCCQRPSKGHSKLALSTAVIPLLAHGQIQNCARLLHGAGSGSIINDKSNNERIRLSISQNDITPLLLAKKIWGDSVRERNRISLNGKMCNGNEWTISQNFALKFIEDIKSFMIIPYKINQINVTLEKMNKGNNIKYKCNFCDSIYSAPAGRNILKKE
jgi:hypothetical protein